MFTIAVVCLLFYSLGIIATAAYLFEEKREIAIKSGTLKATLALAWPAYFALYRAGARDSVVAGGLLVYWIAVFLFPAFYLGRHWAECDGGTLCGFATIGKALLWALFWPAYFAAELAGPAT